MKRGLAALAWVLFSVFIGACVNVDKPSAVAGCEKSGKCTNRGPDGSAGPEVLPTQDAEANGDLEEVPFQDAGTVFDADAGGASDRAPDRVPDIGQDGSGDVARDVAPDVARDVAPDVAQDVARDVAIDGPSGPCWNAGSPVAAGTRCRLAVGLCDVPEVCDGVSAACPPDKYAPTTTVCRPAAGLCDIPESCTGTSPDCPVDAFMTRGAVCRPVAGPCDLAESCSGTGPNCPADGRAPPGTICRASTDNNQCDPAEICTGSAVTCPADVVYTLPPPPTNVAAVSGTLQATISWTAAPGATGYDVKRSATSGSGYTTQGAPPTATVSPYVNIGLTGGSTYYYVVTSVNTIASCESGPSAEVNVNPSGICTPSAPAAPTVTPTSSDGQVLLSWTASTGATSYTVARSTTTGTGYMVVATTVTTGTSYNDINVSNGTTYYYVVTASNGTCSSSNSAEVSGTPSCTPPAAPTNLVATANIGSVALTWTAPTGAVSYRILRSTTSGFGYTLAGTSGTASYTDTSVIDGTTYYYVVSASSGSCNSANSAQVLATPACTPPSTPTNLVATPGNGQIVLAWTASTGGAILYQVLRSAKTGGPYAIVATPTSTGYTDAGLTNGTTYYYVVNASNGSCSSANSAELPAVPVCTPPSVPAITATPGDSQVVLSWTASTGGAVSYVVSRGTVSGGPYATVVANPTGTTYTDKTVVNGTTYYYVVSSNNGTCLSANSAVFSAKPVAACAQAAPIGVTATAGNQRVTLTWTAATGAISYNVGRSATSGTGYTSVGTVTAPTTTFVDTDPMLADGTTYYYVVSASSGACTSLNSSEVHATPACVLPAVPTGVTATADNSNGRITVSWNTVTGATAYTVSRGASASGSFSSVSTNQTAATFTDSGLTAGTVYYYVVSSSNAGGTCASGDSTPAVSARSCSSPSVPSGVNATAGILRVTVSWTASTGSPTSYEVKRGTAATGPFTLSLGTPTESPYIDSSAAPGMAYYYVVAARNAGGVCSSADSSVAPAAARNCTVVSGAGANGHTGFFNTYGGLCFVTCDTIQGWGCANTDARSVSINGGPVTCGATPIPPAKTAGYNVIDVSAGDPNAGAKNYSEIYWWGTWSSSCTIPAGGLDF